MTHSLSKNIVLKNLTLMIFITTKAETAEDIYQLWETHTVARDYKKPSIAVIEEWIRELIRK